MLGTGGITTGTFGFVVTAIQPKSFWCVAVVDKSGTLVLACHVPWYSDCAAISSNTHIAGAAPFGILGTAARLLIGFPFILMGPVIFPPVVGNPPPAPATWLE